VPVGPVTTYTHTHTHTHLINVRNTDILFPFEFWLRGWFFEFTNSVFEVLFIAGLMLFWLIVIDKIGKVPCTWRTNQTSLET
jgi:hypothetical protein